jgi:hypothetical protein
MDQLYNNDSPAFTTWVIENDLLEEPFVVIDVGVQGGPHPCWKHLKDNVRIYGFDAVPEVVEELNARKQPINGARRRGRNAGVSCKRRRKFVLRKFLLRAAQ